MKRLSFGKSNQIFGTLTNDVSLESIVFSPFQSTRYELNDGTAVDATCLNCVDHPCMKYGAEELVTSVMEAMPRDTNTNVCPTNAIRITPEGLFPFIEEDSCFGCGLCLSRCTYGAINFENHKAKISRSNHDVFDFSETHNNPKTLEKRTYTFQSTKSRVSLHRLSKEFVGEVYEAILSLNKRSNGFDNLLSRNLLLNLGVRTKVRAIGNNDVRMDLLGEQNDLVVTGEIDFGGLDKLDLSRSILDDIAILHSRYKVPKEKILPILIIDTFPNRRSDFYEVLTDIKNVTGTEIKTLSLQFLLLLNLFRRSLQMDEVKNGFFADKNNTSIQESSLRYFSELSEMDPFFDSNFYMATK